MVTLMSDETYSTLPWRERPVEEARLFNPAFCGELIGRTIWEFHQSRQMALNMVLAFLVLPLTLHETTRQELPKMANAAFAGWVANHATLLAEFPARVRRLQPVSREALLFAIKHQVITLEADGFVPGTKPIRNNAKPEVTSNEVDGIRRAARLLGRWFAAQGTQTSILIGMGITP